jgi:hypothetical protein
MGCPNIESWYEVGIARNDTHILRMYDLYEEFSRATGNKREDREAEHCCGFESDESIGSNHSLCVDRVRTASLF